MYDEGNSHIKRGQRENVKTTDILTSYREDIPSPLNSGKGKPPTYRPINDAGRRILQALAKGYTTSWIIEHVKDPDASRLQRQHIFYWKDKGVKLGILIESGRDGNNRKAKIYRKGPNYDLLNSKGWQYQDFLPFVCRVHSPGNAVHVKIKAAITDPDDHITLTSWGVRRRFKLARHGSYPRYLDTKFRIAIPFEVIGYRGAEAIIYFRLNPTTNDYLSISPPEVRLTLDKLSGRDRWLDNRPEYLDPEEYYEGHDDDPYRNIVEYILAVFSANGWEFDGWRNVQEFHYAFSYQEVKSLNRSLLQAPHYSGKFPEEKGLTIWIDHSHGKWELETSDKWIAIEMMTVLELSRKRFTGEREFPEGWGESKFREVSDGHVE